MSAQNKIVYFSEEQFVTLVENGTITVNGVTIEYVEAINE